MTKKRDKKLLDEWINGLSYFSYPLTWADIKGGKHRVFNNIITYKDEIENLVKLIRTNERQDTIREIVDRYHKEDKKMPKRASEIKFHELHVRLLHKLINKLEDELSSKTKDGKKK